MSKVDEIMELLEGLTLLDASDLVTKIEDKFGVDASASGGGMMMMAAGAGDAGGAAAEEKTEFDLVLTEFPADKKIAVLKVVRGITGLGLKEAKDIVDAAPKVVKETLDKASAEEALKKLTDAGATGELK